MSAAEDFLEFEVAEESDAADCVAFVSDNQTHAVVSAVARQFFVDPIVRDGDGVSALQYVSESPHPKALIVDIGEVDDPLSTMLSLATAVPEEIRLIGIGSVNDIGVYREMIEAGVLDYLVKPVSERALASALSRVNQSTAEFDQGNSPTQRIAVVGTRGGSGTSTVAVNLAWLLADSFDQQTTLVDLDLWWGTIALSLDLEPTHGLREALENPSRIDSLFIASSVAKLSDRLAVMAAEEPLAGEMSYYTGATEILIEALSHANRCLVIDLPRQAFRMRHPVLEAATQVLLVTPPSLSGLRDSIRLLGAIQDANAADKVKVVLNRTGGVQQTMGLADFQKALGRKIDFQIPDDPKAFKEAANTGKPTVVTAPRCKAAKVLRSIAESIPLEVEEESKSSGKLWRRILKRA